MMYNFTFLMQEVSAHRRKASSLLPILKDKFQEGYHHCATSKKWTWNT